MKAAYLKTTAQTNVSIRIPGETPKTLCLELPAGCTVSVCYEGDAESIGFTQLEVQGVSKN